MPAGSHKAKTLSPSRKITTLVLEQVVLSASAMSRGPKIAIHSVDATCCACTPDGGGHATAYSLLTRACEEAHSLKQKS